MLSVFQECVEGCHCMRAVPYVVECFYVCFASGADWVDLFSVVKDFGSDYLFGENVQSELLLGYESGI